MPDFTQLTRMATRPALDRWSAARAEHDRKVFGPDGAVACKCGWTPPGRTSSPARSVGLHQAAADKRADKAYDADCRPIIDRLIRSLDALVKERAILHRVLAQAAADGDTVAVAAARQALDAICAVLQAYAELGDDRARLEVAREEQRAALDAVHADNSPTTRQRLRDADDAVRDAERPLLTATARTGPPEELPEEEPTGWFVAWRCGGTTVEQQRGDVPADCPEHPDAERLAAPEWVQMAAGRPYGLRHCPVPGSPTATP